MTKLIDEKPSFSSEPIGRAGLLRLIDDMNSKRAYLGIRERYKPVENDNGEMMMAKDWIGPAQSANAPSPTYSALRLASSR